jgi:CRP/FNR family cyclic AMP-dependent transcriptional regulator
MARYAGDLHVLKRLAPFSWFSDAQLASALSTIEHRNYARGSVIQSAGREGDGIYIVLSGRVCVLHDDGQDHEFLAARIGPNDFFGELALLDQTACVASVRAECDSEVLHIPRRVALDCLEENPKAAMCMLRTVVERLCDAQRQVGHLALTTVEQRVASVILDNSVEADGVWRVQVGSEQISTMVAASREMVSRVLKRMIDGGAVSRHRRSLVIVDRDAVASRTRPTKQRADAASQTHE